MIYPESARFHHKRPLKKHHKRLVKHQSQGVNDRTVSRDIWINPLENSHRMADGSEGSPGYENFPDMFPEISSQLDHVLALGKFVVPLS